MPSFGSGLVWGGATDEFIRDTVATFIQNGTGITWVHNDAGDTLTPTVSLRLDQLTNPTGNKSFNMGDNTLTFTWLSPTGADGALELSASGNFSGDLLHVHQHSGNPGAGTHLVHLEFEDNDVIGLGIIGPNNVAANLLKLSNGTVDILTVLGSGLVGIGGIPSTDALLHITGAWAGSTHATGLRIRPTLTPSVGGTAYGELIWTNFTSAASGTHSTFAGLFIQIGTETAGGATVTNAAGIYITNAPTIATNNYAIYAGAGNTAFLGTSHAFGTSLNQNVVVRIGGTLTATAGAYGLYVLPVLQPAVSNSAAILRIDGTVDAAASGTHPVFTGLHVSAPTINTSTSTITTASSIYISAAPTVGTNNYALYAASGACTFVGAVVSHSFGAATDTTTMMKIGATSTFTPTGSVIGSVLYVAGRVAAASGQDAYAVRLGAATIDEAGSGTHALFAGVYIAAPTITAGAATLTAAATLHIAGAPSGATSNYALRVAAGVSRFDGNIDFRTTTASGSSTATMTNAPAAGNPAVWVQIQVSGTTRSFPAW